DQHKTELSKITHSLRQVDFYQSDLQSKIAVAKRTALKAEADITRTELEKKRQDYFVDTLTQQLQRLQERRALYEMQLVAQQGETKAALETLQDAATEMEAIQFEKRQLIQQWRSSLLGLQRRDEMMQQIEEGIQKNKSELLNMTNELSGFKHSLRKAASTNESLTLLLNRLENEVDYLKNQITQVTEAKDRLKESYTMYTKSLSQTESELAQVLAERQALQLEINAIVKQTGQVVGMTQKLEGEIAERLQSQVSIEKGQSATKRDAGKLRALLHEREAHIATVQNELSVLRLDSLNVQQRIARIKESCERLDREIALKNSIIEKYETEIRKRNDDLGKKQAEMDLLNKKYDQLTAKNQDESMGPLEATIHNLTKSVQMKEKECADLQTFWLRAQNELVAMSKGSGELSDEIGDLKMQLTVLNRKKMVVNTQFETEQKEIRDHQRQIRSLQTQMTKINTLLCKQANIQAQLEQNNVGLEQEFRAKLKGAELECVRLEARVDEIRGEKEKALTGLIEAERQMMLWEKKIQLAKETAAALDPNVGATEIREMSAEIHRMKLRYASMLKVQERMIAEMEKSVYRRESINTRTKMKGKGGGGQAALQKTITELSKKIRQIATDLKECENDATSLSDAKERVERQIEETNEACRSLEVRERSLLQDLEERMQKKSVITTETMLYQKMLKRYQDVKEGKYTFLIRDPVARKVELMRQQERLKKVEEVMKNVE
ncbi:Coiled-coil domain-containing protein 40, partial [Quaeritorhiza haematococci]